MVEDIETGKYIRIKDTVRERKYRCICCKEELIYNKGNIKINKYFRHKNNSECSEYENFMSPWHCDFQEQFKNKNINIEEILINGEHRADIFIKNKNRVIELQHSDMGTNDCTNRTNDYLNNNYQIWWLFDLSEDYTKSYLLKKFEEIYNKEFDYKEIICKCPIKGCNKNIINAKFGPYCPIHKNKININLGCDSGYKINAYIGTKWLSRDYIFANKDVVTLKIKRGIRKELKEIKDNYLNSNLNFKCFVYLKPDTIAEISEFNSDRELTIVNFMTDEDWINYCINNE